MIDDDLPGFPLAEVPIGGWPKAEEPWIAGSWAKFIGGTTDEEEIYVVEEVAWIEVDGKMKKSLRFKNLDAGEMDWFSCKCFENVTPI